MSEAKTTKHLASSLPSIELIEQRIFLISGQKVMLDSDLASLYGVATKILNQAIRRNSDRFPQDFMFQLTEQEAQVLRSQFVTSNEGRGGRRYLPYVFTEQGVAMLSSVLNSERAIQVNIAIMRAFVRFRSILAAHKELAKKVASLEKETTATFKVVFDLIKKYLAPEEKPEARIGYRTK